MKKSVEQTKDLAQWLKPALYILGLLGTCQTWGRAAVDGSLWHLFHALHGSDEYILPSTHSTPRTVFTGITWPIDYLLRLLVIFFWEAVDGSHPSTSAIGLYFLGQYTGFLTIIYTDSLRTSRNNFSKTTLWLIIFQLTAIGSSGWIWALSFLASSQTIHLPTLASSGTKHKLCHSSTSQSPISILVLPAAIGLGYLAPAAAMALRSPDVVSNTFQQIAIAVWNVFPLLVLVAHYSLTALARLLSQTGPFAHWKTLSHISAVRFTNLVALVGTVISHTAVSTLSLATLVFPGIFAPGFTKAFSPASLAVPPISVTYGKTVGDGVRSFLMWDQVFGYTFVLIVMIMQLQAAVRALGRNFNWTIVVLSTLVTSVIAGPGSACVLLSWARDEILLGQADSA